MGSDVGCGPWFAAFGPGASDLVNQGVDTDNAQQVGFPVYKADSAPMAQPLEAGSHGAQTVGGLVPPEEGGHGATDWC